MTLSCGEEVHPCFPTVTPTPRPRRLTRTAHFDFTLIDEVDPEVVLVEILSHEITDPTHAAEFDHQLGLLIRREFPKNFVIDFHKLRSLSSSAFAVLFSFVLKIREAGGRVKICNMDEFIRFGARFDPAG